MKTIIYILLPMLILASNASGQKTIDSVLINIAKNNKTIVANTKFWDAKKLEYQTGLTPYNPKIDYDYLIGRPSYAGNQTDFSITQSLDFPTVYARKKKLADEQIKQAEFLLNAHRQEVLLQAKLICIELIYRYKYKAEVNIRKQNTEKWLADFQKSLEKGDGNIMDVNKAKLELLEVRAEVQENQSIINQLSEKLTELNGGISIPFADTVYASLSAISDFETLEQEIETNDPMRKYLEQEKIIGQKEVSLSKSLALPKIEAGYHHQSILGQRFNGVHLGMTVPLWESKNKVKAQMAELVLFDANLQDHINEHYYDIKQKYEQMANLKITLDEYQNLFKTWDNITLLDKSLLLGQISTLEYFKEISYYYEALKSYLKTEMEYHKVLAALYKFRL